MKKFFYAIVMVLCVAGNIFISTAQAKIKLYEGEFLITNETLDFAKNKAKLYGARNIAEQIFLQVQSSTEVKNFKLNRDEIITRSESLMNIIDVKYKVEMEGENFLIKAFVTAEVDTDEIEKIIQKFQWHTQK